ncbi:phosphatidylinositol 4,5-bisphosphate 3-kinase catalytic subunit delta isoform-like [Branchiostoma floridae x Branchiostoma japonicum]
MPPVEAFMLDIWAKEADSPTIQVDCLLPTGIYIPLTCSRDATIEQIKKDLWQEARTYPLYSELAEVQSYVFMCINQTAEQEELHEEQRRLCDVRPFRPVLKLVQKKKDPAAVEKLLNSQISVLIGKGLHEFDSMKDPEVDEFRGRMRQMVRDIADSRKEKSWVERLQYQFPPRLESSEDLPKHMQPANNNLVVNIRFHNTDMSYSFQVHVMAFPIELHQLALKKKASFLRQPEEDPADFTLKVCGQFDYLIGEFPISRFKYVRKCLSKATTPQLMLVNLDNIDLEPVTSPTTPDPEGPPPLPCKQEKMVSLWNIEARVKITVVNASSLNAVDNNKVFVKAGLYHGGETLCSISTTKEASCVGGDASWSEVLEFDLDVNDLPRMARICLAIYEAGKKGRKSKKGRESRESYPKDSIPLGWVNITMFDYRDHLRSGTFVLHTWPWPDSGAEVLNPIGTVVSNPNFGATALQVELHSYHACPIIYPPFDKVLECAANIRAESQVAEESIYSGQDSHGSSAVSHGAIDQLQCILDRELMAPMFDQDMEMIWQLREKIHELFPHALAKLLSSVKWNNHRDVAQMQALLNAWSPLLPHAAMELLDYNYADQAVRAFAVKCLNQLTDEELSQYLLQLVQVLKYEAYLDCELARFLLMRGLNNQRIGHYLFWHFRSEMHNPAVSVRFGLLLEAYCRGCSTHMKALSRQMEALSKLKTVNELVKKQAIKNEKHKQLSLEAMKACLKQTSYHDALSHIHNPVEPQFKLLQLSNDHCKFRDSKMRPLWLVFENEDRFGDHVTLMFKDGDDLRQDMLTLQIIQVMEMLWQAEGIDLRMSPYGCLSTGNKVGLVEVVLNADTIANIQKDKGSTATAGFKKGSLFMWLKEKNPEKESLNKAVQEFTLSCAGYCVATYVLGVGDRHSDNIMIKETGQLFHIDFGHFLGNFKTKFGIKRERVPFVLTHDFVHVITKGQSTQGSQEFAAFRQHCEGAYLSLRKYGNLLISLFAMMLSSGLPELTSPSDINYLKDKLALEMTQEEALRHFREEFDNALKQSWKTSVNWWLHNIAKDNK